MFSGNHIRQSFINFFKSKDHFHVLSSSLLPHNDPSILFTNAGMNQFKNYFLGQETADYKRAVSCQKVMRAGGRHNDLENVGYTARHHTFFEMLGNFSLGDYFKKEAIIYAWEWLTKDLKIAEDKLAVSIFYDDQESLDIWHKVIGLPENKIAKLGEADNFWTMGDSGPCGPCSEIHYDMSGEPKAGRTAAESLEADDGRFLEIWNLVFMQFNRTLDGKMVDLPHPSIDTGCGLERISSVLQNVKSNFDTDIFKPLISEISKTAKYTYGQDIDKDTSVRVVADHLRATAFVIADGILPGNDGRGYVVRRIIRRGLRHVGLLEIEHGGFSKIAQNFLPSMWDIYPELKEAKDLVVKVIWQEEERFKATLKSGMVVLDELITQAKAKNLKAISGDAVFKLYDTYGFPADIAAEILANEQLSFKQSEFDKAMAGQKERARSAGRAVVVGKGDIKLYQAVKEKTAKQQFLGYEKNQVITNALALFQQGREVAEIDAKDDFQVLLASTPFYATAGGQVGDSGTIASDSFRLKVTDTTKPFNDFHLCRCRVLDKSLEQLTLENFRQVRAVVDENKRFLTSVNHTATHLLHSALRRVLGRHVKQAGSYVDHERLRLDFTSNTALSLSELKEVEYLVNEQIIANHSVLSKQMALKDALAQGALAFFGEKYGDSVRVVTAGPLSTELCGGTHTSRTGNIALFKLVAEQSIASGIRRVEALTGQQALAYVNLHLKQTNQISKILAANVEDLTARLNELLAKNTELDKQLLSYKAQIITSHVKEVVRSQTDKAESKLVWFDLHKNDSLKDYANIVKGEFVDGLTVLWQQKVGDQGVLAFVTGAKNSSSLNANELLQKIMPLVSGKGGGSPGFAQCLATVKDRQLLKTELAKHLP